MAEGEVEKVPPSGRVTSRRGAVFEKERFRRDAKGLESARRAVSIYICRKWWGLVSPALTSSLTSVSR